MKKEIVILTFRNDGKMCKYRKVERTYLKRAGTRMLTAGMSNF